MSIWQEVGGETCLTGFEGDIFRVVEGQSYIATRKLVDSDEEQEILEKEIERSKPAAPHSNSRGQLDYLLFTPFRYPPLKTGGRFHSRSEQSIFYGSMELETTMAEIAYRRFAFMQATEAQLDPAIIPYTDFKVSIRTSKSVLLTNAPFAPYRDQISHPASYDYSQRLGHDMRKAGVEAFTYYSARKHDGINAGLFSVEAFAKNRPTGGSSRSWDVCESPTSIEFNRNSIRTAGKTTHVFHIEDFYVNGAVPVIG